MKRKILALISVILVLALCCASCDLIGGKDISDETCEHTYAEKWSTNSTEHWHAATCEHAELKSDSAAHNDADENGKCDVCDYEIGHEHTFADTWTTNDTHHWKLATCSHTDEKGELAVHGDKDSNGSCDTCAAHVHVVNIFGVCTVCGDMVKETDVSKIEYIIDTVVLNSNKITSGNILYNAYSSSSADSTYASSEHEIEYLLGESSAYYKDYTYAVFGDKNGSVHISRDESSDTQETWYDLLADGSVFGVFRVTDSGNVGNFELDGAAAPEKLVGYYYAVSNLANEYGAENILKSMYTLSQSNAASDYTYNYSNRLYSFSFNYLLVNTDTAEGEGNHVDYFEVKVSFKVSDTGALTYLNLECDCYTNSPEDELDQDYTYDQNTNTITMKDTAVADTYTYVVNQTEGVRSYVSEHPKSSFIPESFEVFTDEDLTTPLGSTVTVIEGEDLTLYFGNLVPSTANVSYIMETLVYDMEANYFCWGYGSNVHISASEVGSYDVELTLGTQIIAFTLVVEEYVPSGNDQPPNTVAVVITDTYATFLDYANFTAPADGDYTFTIAPGVYLTAIADTDDEPWADFYNKDRATMLPLGGSVTVSLKEGQTYSFAVTSPEKGIFYIPYTVSEYTGSGDNGSGDNGGVATEVVSGSYLGTNSRGQCTLLIDSASNSLAMNGQVFTFTFADGVVTVYMNGNPMSDSILGVTLNSDGTPKEFVYNGTSYTVATSSAGDSVTEIVAGTYTGTDEAGNAYLTVIVEGDTVTFNINHPYHGEVTFVATYEIISGEVVLYDEEGDMLHPLSGTLTIDADGNPTVASYNNTDYTLSID